MTQPTRPDPLQALPLLAGALLTGSLLFLGVAAFIQHSRQPPAGLESVALIAAGWAVVTPFVAGRISALAPRPDLGVPLSDQERQRLMQLTLIAFAILESGVLLCAVALIVQPAQWPLVAALVPAGTMIVSLPSRRH